MEEHGVTSWFSLIPYVRDLSPHVASALFVFFVLLVVARLVYRSVQKAPNPLVPDAKITTRNIMEVLVEGIINIMEGVIGSGAERYLPLVGTLFIFILGCNLLGILPGFLPPTSNINTNAAMALCVFVLYNYYGFREHGLRYVRQFTGPVIWLAPLMFVIEVFSHIFRPFSLSIRLFGNIFGDHMVLEIFSNLIPFGVPVVFMILGLAVAVIQAFIFAVLAAVYIALAVSHEH